MRALPAPPAAAHAARPSAAADSSAPSGYQWKSGAAMITGTGLFFFAYIVVTVVEYLGLPNLYPILKVIKFSTLVSYGLLLVMAMRAGTLDVFLSRPAQLLLGFLVLTIASVSWAYVQQNAVNSIRPFVDYTGMMIVTAYILDRRKRFETLALVLGAVATLLVVRNHDKLGGARVGAFLAPSFMGDGNDLAWWLTLTLPIAFSPVLMARSRLMRLAALGMSGVTLMGILGTQSRGAGLGLGLALMYGWLFVSTKKWVGGVALVFVIGAAAVVAPKGYMARMQTVAEYQDDNSAQARIQAWTGGFHMALDHPIGVGAGNFSSAYGRFYMPGADSSRLNWGQNRWFNAHSIYFKVLGEYGFPGLLMLLSTIGSILLQNRRTRQLLRKAPSPTAPFDDRLPALLSMSTIGWAVAGGFLSGFNYPHAFFLAGVSFAMWRVVNAEYRAGAPASAPQAASTAEARPAQARPSVVLPGGRQVPALGRAHLRSHGSV